MDASASHIGFVIGAYVLSAAVLVLLLVATLARDRHLRADVERLEQPRRQKPP